MPKRLGVSSPNGFADQPLAEKPLVKDPKKGGLKTFNRSGHPS